MEHPKSIEHRSGFETFAGTRHLILAALARNQEHMGRTFDVGRVLGLLWNDCIDEIALQNDRNFGAPPMSTKMLNANFAFQPYSR